MLQPGQLQQIGPHRVQCGDVTEGLDALMGAQRAEILYVDPPWGAGMLKFFATQTKRHTGESVNVPPLDEFLNTLFTVAARHTSRYLAVEYGLRWEDKIQRLALLHGFDPWLIMSARYKSGKLLRPLHVHVFTVGDQPRPARLVSAVAGTHGPETPAAVLSVLAPIVRADNPRPVVLDPCCGVGNTARAALETGLIFRGNEVDGVRLAKTVSLLERAHLASSRELP